MGWILVEVLKRWPNVRDVRTVDIVPIAHVEAFSEESWFGRTHDVLGFWRQEYQRYPMEHMPGQEHFSYQVQKALESFDHCYGAVQSS
jgi:hypothetical protein